GGEDQETVAGFDFDGRLGGEALAAAVPPDQPILAGCPRLAAGETPRAVAPAFAHQRERGGLVEGQLTADAIASSVLSASAAPPPLPASPAPPPQSGPEHPQRVVGLDRLPGSVLRVRHPGLDARLPVASRSSPLTSRDRLVVGEAVVPDQAVVHRPLGGG